MIELTCPTPGNDASLAALATLQTAGERTKAIEATDLFDELGIAAAATPEALIEAAATALADAYEPTVGVAIDWDADETTPLVATVQVLGLQDDSVDGTAFAIEAVATDAGWVVARVTTQNICARGVAAGTNDQFCI